jgi:tetratricopeptide (TPR) repeat protein
MGAKGRKSKKPSSHTKRDGKQRRNSPSTGLHHSESRKHPPAKKTLISKIFKSEKKQKNIEKISRESITGWRLWLFRIVAITVIPALLFLLLEIVLHVFGSGFPTGTTIKCEVNGTASYCNNHKFAWQFFPPAIAREASSFAFPADKMKNTYRVFVMGASAAAGTPDDAFSFGRILQVMLRQRYPQANFEVITAAMPAINSHVVLKIAKDCAHHEADLFIIYLGNNEVVGPYGAGTIFTPLSSNIALIRLQIALKATKLGQLITNLLESAGVGNVPKVWGGMKMFLEKQVRLDDTSLGIVYQHFQRNLQDISHLARKNGINIIFCTVPSNLKDSPPFASLHRPNITDAEKEKWDELYQQGVIFETNGDFNEAVEQYSAAGDIDDHFADLQFRLGQCDWAMGKYDKARERFIQARQLDTLRFRSDTRINKIIRDIAGNKAADGVYLVDAVKVFQENSPRETPGEELFYEHVHMNFTGNYLLAKSVFEQVEKILPERIKRYKADEKFCPTETECARYLAYTDWDRHGIADQVLSDYIKQAPFTNQLYHDQRVRRMEQELKTLKVHLSPEVLSEVEVQYRWAIQQDPSDWWLHWKYGIMLEELEKYSTAVEQYRLVLNYMPYHYEACAKLGLLFGKQGDLNAAIAYNKEAIRINPVYADAYYNLGFAYHLLKRLDEAAEHYSKVIEFRQDFAQAYNNLAVVQYQQGKLDEAVQTYRNGLLFVPDDLNLHYNLGIMLRKQGHRDEAVKELRRALQIDPNSAKVRRVLKSIEGRN